MLYIRGANGTCLVRVMRSVQPDQLVCTVLNDGTVVTVSRETDALFAAQLQTLFNKIATITGAPLQVSGASDLV
jgi:hypothetical protein